MRSGDSSATPVSPWVTASEADQENAQDRKHITKLKRDKMYLKDLLKEMGQFVDIIVFVHSTFEAFVANDAFSTDELLLKRQRGHNSLSQF